MQKVQFPQHQATKQEFIKSIVKFICQSGSSFSTVANPYFRQLFTSYTESVPILTRNNLAKDQLTLVYEETMVEVTQALNAYIQSGGKLKLQVDGWAGPKRKKYVNVVIKTDTRYFYWDSLILSQDHNEHESGKNVAQFLRNIVNKFGEGNVIAIGTDNASNMRTTWEIICKEFKTSTIFCYSCTAHALNIFAKEVIASSKFREIFKAVKAMLALMKNNEFLEFYLDLKQTPFGKMIPTYIEVRWCSTYTSLKFIYDHYEIIKLYSSFCGISCILFDDGNFEKLHILCDVLGDIKEQLRHLEEDTSYIGDSYGAFSVLLHKMAMNSDNPELQKMLKGVWNRSYNDINAVGFVLNPYCLYFAKTDSNLLIHHQYRQVTEHFDKIVDYITRKTLLFLKNGLILKIIYSLKWIQQF